MLPDVNCRSFERLVRELSVGLAEVWGPSAVVLETVRRCEPDIRMVPVLDFFEDALERISSLEAKLGRDGRSEFELRAARRALVRWLDGEIAVLLVEAQRR